MEDKFGKELNVLLPDKIYKTENLGDIIVYKARFGQTRQLSSIVDELIQIAINNKLDLDNLSSKENIWTLINLGIDAIEKLMCLLTNLDNEFIKTFTIDDVIGIVELIIKMHMGSNTEKKLKSILNLIKSHLNQDTH